MGSIFHVFTNAIANEAPAGRVRPIDWNSAHAYSLQDAISAGTTRITSGEAIFSNANGVSFGADGQTVTASIVAQSNQPRIQSVSAGTTRVTTGEVVFSNANGVSFGADGQTVTASHNGLTSQSNQAFSAQGGSSTFQTLSFNNANGVTFSNNGGAVEASYTVPTLTSLTLSDAATSITVARLAFTQSNGLTLSLSTNGGSATVIGSYTVPTITNSSWTVSDAAGSGTVARLAFTNLNGVTLSLSTGGGGSHTIVGSHNALTVQSAQSAIKAFGASNVGNTAGNTGVSTGIDWVLAGSTNITVSESTAAGGPNTLWLSVPNVSAGNVTFSAGTSSAGLGSVVFSNSNGVSFGLNGSTITASYNPTTLSYWAPAGNFGIGSASQANSSVSVRSMQLGWHLACSNLKVVGSVNVATAANNSSAYLDVSLSAVLYTRSVSTLNSVFSCSDTFTATWSSNASGSISGLQWWPLTFAATTLTPGEYWWAVHMSTTSTATGGAATTALNNTISMQVCPSIASGQFRAGKFGVGTNASQAVPGALGIGVLSTNSTMDSFGFSDLVVTGNQGNVALLDMEVANFTIY